VRKALDQWDSVLMRLSDDVSQVALLAAYLAHIARWPLGLAWYCPVGVVSITLGGNRLSRSRLPKHTLLAVIKHGLALVADDSHTGTLVST
jgi:hypothetical protein